MNTKGPTIHPSDYNALGGIGSLLAGISSGVIGAYGGRAPDYLQAGYLTPQEQNNAMYDLQQARDHDRNAARINEFMTGISSPDPREQQAAAMNNPDLYNVYAQMQPKQDTYKPVEIAGQTVNEVLGPNGMLKGYVDNNGQPIPNETISQLQKQQYTAKNSKFVNGDSKQMTLGNDGKYHPVETGRKTTGPYVYNTLEDLDPSSSIYKQYDKIDTNLSKQSDAFQEIQNQTDALLSSLHDGANQYEIQSALIRFSKINDPTSVVRESEFATTVNNSGVADMAENYLSKMKSGMSLTKEQISDLRRAVINLHKSSARTYQRRYNNVTKNFSKKAKMNPDLFLPPVEVSNFGSTDNDNGHNVPESLRKPESNNTTQPKVIDFNQW